MTEAKSKKVVSLPTGVSVTSDDIKTICEVIRHVISNKDEIAVKLKELGEEQKRFKVPFADK